MTFSDWITTIAAGVTLVSMFVSIRQARSALTSSRTAKTAMASVRLATVVDRLKFAQEHIRDVAPDKVLQRGYKVGNRIDRIRQEFDGALSVLPKVGPGSDARELLTKAQLKLNQYETSFSAKPDSAIWQNMQVFVQDAMSNLTSTTLALGEKNDK